MTKYTTDENGDTQECVDDVKWLPVIVAIACFIGGCWAYWS